MKNIDPVKFTAMSEISMGSPYNAGKVRVDGFDHPCLDQEGFQDRYVYDQSKQRLILVRWDKGYNIPGFHLLMLDLKKQRIYRSPVMFGCCRLIAMEEGGVNMEIFDRGNVLNKNFKLAMINQAITHDPC